MKTISFRANDEDLELIKQIKEQLQKEYLIKRVTTSDILSAGIKELWEVHCLPYEKPYEYRAEKD